MSIYLRITLFVFLVTMPCAFSQTQNEKKEISAQFQEERIFSDVAIRAGGFGEILNPIDVERFQPDETSNILTLEVQDSRGKSKRYTFLATQKMMQGLNQGGILVVHFRSLTFSEIFSVDLEITAGFEHFFIDPVGMSLEDAFLKSNQKAVFGFGVLKQ